MPLTEGNANKPLNFLCREKYWKELSEQEKTERMRGEVKCLIERVDRLARDIDRLECQFANHEHLNGKVYSDIKSREPQSERCYKPSREQEANGEVRF